LHEDFLTTLLAAGTILGTVCIGAAPAIAQPAGFSFRIGDVAFAYSDGYYDHGRRWHAWRGARERDWYRALCPQLSRYAARPRP
jgi:hypothetical protein